MTNRWIDMPYPANGVQNDGAMHQYTAGIPPHSPQAINGFAFHGAVRPSPTTPITRQGLFFGDQGFSWDLGGLQGPQLSQHGLEHGNVRMDDFSLSQWNMADSRLLYNLVVLHYP